jgi:hypothetical protein
MTAMENFRRGGAGSGKLPARTAAGHPASWMENIRLGCGARMENIRLRGEMYRASLAVEST